MITLEYLKNLNRNFINLRQLITASGINYTSLMKRISRGSPEIDKTESHRIEKQIKKISKAINL